MPAAAAYAVASWVASGAAIATGVYTAVYAAVYLVVTLAINYGINKIAQSTAGKPKVGNTSATRDVTVQGTVEPMQIGYGEIKAAGFIAYYGSSGSSNKYLHMVVVYFAHQSDAITDVWCDARRVQDVSIQVSGEVTATEFKEDGASKLYVWRHLGTKGQTWDTNVDSPRWTSAHRGAGLTYVHYRLEKSEKVWPGGAPSSFYALTKTRRLYDPRKDSTNGGSGSHRVTDARTWQYSNNATLARRDYISGGSRWYDVATPEPRLGFNAPNSRIDDAYTIAAANVDDEDVAIPDGSGGSTTQKRYTCDVQLSCGDTHRENLDVLNSACVGDVACVNGKYRLYSGAYDTPDLALTEDDIVGDVTLVDPQGEDRYNFITGTFYDDAREWSLTPFPNISNASFETDDGGQKPRSIQLHATRNSYRAQRIGALHLALSRDKDTVRFERLSPKAMKITQRGTFTATVAVLGWSSKAWRCLDWEFLPDGFIAVTAKETNSSRYADPAVGDYAEPGEAEVETPQYDEPETPINFRAVSMPDGIHFKWGMPAPLDSRVQFVLYEHTASTPFSSATEVWRGADYNVFLERPGQTAKYYWIVATLNGIVSTETPVGAGQIAAPFVQGLQEEFYDSFEHQDYARYYNVREGAPTVTYPTNGESGGRVLRFQNHGWIASNKNIVFDPNALYKLTVRVRMVTAPTGGVSAQDIFYAGLEGVAADGVTLVNAATGANSYNSQHYPAGLSGVDMSGFSLGTWQVLTAYLKGNSASPSGGAITNPYELYTGVKFVRPLLILNYNNGNGIMEVDYLKLEKVIDTASLSPNAATETYFFDDLADTSHGLFTYVGWTFTPQWDGVLEVTATYDCITQALDGLGNSLRRYTYIQQSAVFQFGPPVQNGNGTTWERNAHADNFNVAAGAYVEYGLYLEGGGRTKGLRIKATLIKR